MKIYFAGSIRGGRDDQNLYSLIIEHLKSHGEVLSEFVGNPALSSYGTEMPEDDAYTQDTAMIDSADVMVAEVTVPSLGVGYEVGYAEAQNMPVLCLYREREGRSLSAMIDGNPKLHVFRYKSIRNAKPLIDSFFESINNK